MALRWGRADQLGLEGLLGLALVVVLVLGVGAPVLLLLGSGEVTAPVALDPAVVQGVPGLTGTVQGEVVLRAPDLGARLLAGLPTLAGALLAAAVLWRLVAVARSARTSEVFVEANARRLRDVALLIALGGTAVSVLGQVCATALAQRATDRSALVLELPLLPVGVGLLVAFLAEVMRRGVTLRDEVDGLV